MPDLFIFFGYARHARETSGYLRINWGSSFWDEAETNCGFEVGIIKKILDGVGGDEPLFF